MHNRIAIRRSVIDAKPKILVVEDDAGILTQLKWCFDDYEVLVAETRQEAIAQLRRHEPPVVLQDLGLPPDTEGVSEGMASLREILDLAPFTKVIVVTGKPDKENAVKAVGIGAYDFYQKPVDNDVLRLLVARAMHIYDLERQNRRLKQTPTSSPVDGVIAISESMTKVCRVVEKIAPANVTVLLLGESGTGKELLARSIHALSGRKEEQFVPINCAAIPENLLESELFGHEKGSFTGAHKQMIGKVEYANGGTLFLDEIGDMAIPLQAKMLRFLQERVIERIGGRKEIQVDVRVVCATNQDLKALIETGGFREDLYYRIGEISVELPPLRDRAGDIELLAKAFLDKHNDQPGAARKTIGADALNGMESYRWPGNVRELENKIKTAAIMAEGNVIQAADLQLPAAEGEPGGLELNLRTVRTRVEIQAIRQALVVTDHNIARAAELLGITRPTLYSLIEKHGLSGS